jgi:hypothetical protein
MTDTIRLLSLEYDDLYHVRCSQMFWRNALPHLRRRRKMEVAHASEMSMRLHGDTSQISVFFMIMVLQTLTLHATFFIKFLP